MSNPATPEPPSSPEIDESFDDLLSQYERSHSSQDETGQKRIQGIVISISGDAVFLDIGYKIEGVLPVTAFEGGAESIRPGDVFPVSIQGRNEEGYYSLSRFRAAQPKDWPSLERAFAAKSTIAGTVTGATKGGFTVDIGVRAFMPASRSGARDSVEAESLVGQIIRCRILKLDVADEDVVVDRRSVLEEEAQSARERRFADIAEGEVVRGIVRSLTDFGAFVDLGGTDGLLHIGDIAWGRIEKPGDVLSVGQPIEVKVLKIDPEKRRIALGLKQMQPDPWDTAQSRFKVGDRVRGVVTRVTEFGAFVELEPGIEGLIHLSEMSWVKKVRKPGDLLKAGETVDAIVLAISPAEHRMSLSLKQALGDPWADAVQKFPAGSQVEGSVVNMTKFGAFVQIAEGVEGMVHISEIAAEKRIDHPQNVLRLGQRIRALVLDIDTAKRQLRLSIKQLVPGGFDEYAQDHKVGDNVTGRVVEISGDTVHVELGEGIHGLCRMASVSSPANRPMSDVKTDLSSLSAMLSARWKNGPASPVKQPDTARAGQIRSFRITALDAEAKAIELEMQ